MSWHADQALLRRYADGATDEATAFSLEAHLLRCEICQTQARTVVELPRLTATWSAIEERIDAPRTGPVERLLLALGVRDHLARLLAATPSLQLSWFLAVGIAVGFSVIAARESERAVLGFLIVAALIPVMGVALAYGPRIDPTYEIGLSAPMRNGRLLLLRAVAVITTTIALVGAGSLALPGTVGWKAMAWLLPALGLTLSSLALSTWFDPMKSAIAVALAWTGAIAVDAVSARGGPILERLDAFNATGQVAFAAVAAAACVVLVVRASRFDQTTAH